MSTPTAQELKDFVDANSEQIEGAYIFQGFQLKAIFDYYADAINAKKDGYRYLKAVVFSEQFSESETVNIADPQDKLILQDNIDFAALSVTRVSAGQYRVITGYDNALIENLRDNGRTFVQPFQDLSSNNYLRSGDAVFVGSDVSIATKLTYISNGIFDVYLVASKGTNNEALVDCNFYLTIELFNMPII